MREMVLVRDTLTTPIGELVLLADEECRLRAIDWVDHEERMHRLLARQYRLSKILVQEQTDPFGLTHALGNYFDGDLHALHTLSVATEGTMFQRRVWQLLREIPAGETNSYGGGLERKRWLLEHERAHRARAIA